MTHRAAEIPLRISRGDSLKKLVLASGDASPVRAARKFFHCQKPRLRVRATRCRSVVVSWGCMVQVQFVDRENQRNACGTGISCNLDKCRRRFFAHFSHRLASRHDVVARRALHPPALSRQHFLKRDAVFLSVLVYSGCSAFRFPSARSDQVVSPVIGDPTNSGGQHGQESEEGEEGEERSEEDCQEDQEGFQEEEVTRLTKKCRRLDAGTSLEPSGSLLLEANSKPEGSGRRKRVSARHQVKRPDRGFRRGSLFPKNGPAEEPAWLCWHSSIGAELLLRNSTGGLRRSGICP